MLESFRWSDFFPRFEASWTEATKVLRHEKLWHLLRMMSAATSMEEVEDSCAGEEVGAPPTVGGVNPWNTSVCGVSNKPESDHVKCMSAKTPGWRPAACMTGKDGDDGKSSKYSEYQLKICLSVHSDIEHLSETFLDNQIKWREFRKPAFVCTFPSYFRKRP